MFRTLTRAITQRSQKSPQILKASRGPCPPPPVWWTASGGGGGGVLAKWWLWRKAAQGQAPRRPLGPASPQLAEPGSTRQGEEEESPAAQVVGGALREWLNATAPACPRACYQALAGAGGGGGGKQGTPARHEILDSIFCGAFYLAFQTRILRRTKKASLPCLTAISI